jgi:hypothetical protein
MPIIWGSEIGQYCRASRDVGYSLGAAIAASVRDFG